MTDDIAKTAATQTQVLALELGLTDSAQKEIIQKHLVAMLAMERRDKWEPIDSAPKDSEFLAYGSYLYPGDKAVTEYTMIAEVSFGDAEFPYRTIEGTHRKGFFSHWQPLPTAPEGGEQP